MVLTEQSEAICYPAATVEDGSYQNEQALYDIVDGRRVDKTTTGATQSSFGNKLYRVHGGNTNEKVGLGIVLKVMAGDQVKITAESFYTMPGGGPGSPTGTAALSELLTAFVSGGAVAVNHAGLTTTDVSGIGTNSTSIPSFLNGNSEGANNARAFVNYILFDDQMKYVSGGADPVKTNGGYKQHTAFVNSPVSVSKSGYIYVFVSNESNLPVYFDNLAVTHTPGPILEENTYYPFGLAMTGISSKALLTTVLNRYKYNGKEEQRKEFSDGSGLETYDFGARMQDPQLGRWHCLDPMADDYHSFSPYNYVLNNPLSVIDPDGMGTESTHTDSLGNVLAVFNDGDNGVYQHGGNATTQSVEKAHTSDNTSAGGTKMGETEYWDEFANHDANGNILGDKNGNFADKVAKINYGFSIDDYINFYIKQAGDAINSSSSASAAKDWLQKNSKRHAPLDIKDIFGANSGYLLNGKYVSGETAGNYLFGANLETLRKFATLDNLRYPFTNKTSVFYRAAEAFGAYHNSNNKVNNPSVRPYYGEIPYSGRGIVLGYYGGNTNNSIFIDNGRNAIYGNVKIK